MPFVILLNSVSFAREIEFHTGGSVMIKIGAALYLLFATSSAFAGQFRFTVNPFSPVLIPTGNSVYTSGPVAPYFSINNLDLTWSGNGELEVLAILIRSKDGKVSCNMSGSGVAALFPTSLVHDYPKGCSGVTVGTSPVNAISGNVILPATSSKDCSVHVQSDSFYCDGLAIDIQADPFASYNIPLRVTIEGQQTDKNGGDPSRVIANTDVVVH